MSPSPSEQLVANLLSSAQRRAQTTPRPELMTGTSRRYRREFNDPTLASWDVSTGPGMAVSVAGGNLVVTTGTTAASTTTITSRQSFTAPFKAAFGFKVSQKIAQQEFYAEVVAVNNDGTVDDTCVAAWRVAHVDSSTTTTARVEVRNGGAARTQSGNITTFTQTADGIFEVILQSDEVEFHNRPVDTTATRTGSAVRNSVAPDPTRRYVLRYRLVNGATGPATPTTFTGSFVTCIDYTEIQTEITGGPGHGNANSSLPVAITGGTVAVTSTTLSGSSTVTGATPAKVLSAATTNATLVKNSAARVYGYRFANTNTTAFRYVKFYNATTAPTVGTTVPLYTVPLAPNSTGDAQFTIPISHSTGLGYAITASPADNDTTAVAAGEVTGHILYL